MGDKKVRLPLRSQLWFAHRPRPAGKCFPRVASVRLPHVLLNSVSWQTGGGETRGFHFPFPASTTLILPEPLRGRAGTARWPRPGQQLGTAVWRNGQPGLDAAMLGTGSGCVLLGRMLSPWDLDFLISEVISKTALQRASKCANAGFVPCSYDRG